LQTSRFQVFIPISSSFQVHLLRHLRTSITQQNTTTSLAENLTEERFVFIALAGELHGVNVRIKNNGFGQDPLELLRGTWNTFVNEVVIPEEWRLAFLVW